MKSKKRSLFVHSVFLAGSAICFLPSPGLAQTSYWQAPVNGSGNRDGIWAVGPPNWSPSPVGPAGSPWINVGSRIASFTRPEGGTVMVGGLIRLGAIRAGEGGEYTIRSGPGILSFTPVYRFIDVASSGSGVLNIGSLIEAKGLTLSKTGTGRLNLSGIVNVGTLDLIAGSISLSGNNLLDTAKVLNGGVLTLAGSDTVATYTQTSGELAGIGTLTATSGATIQAGSITGTLSGKTTITGDVEVSGSLTGNRLTLEAGTLLLSGTANNSTISIGSAARLINTGGGFHENLIENRGILKMEANDTIFKYVQYEGELSGSGTLTTTWADVMKGTISGSLSGTINVLGDTAVSGAVSGAALAVRHGTLTLSGISTNPSVEIFAGAALLDNNGGLDTLANVTNSGTLTLTANDTVSTYSQKAGMLAGAGMLIVTGDALLEGGSVPGNLTANAVIVRNDTLISGSVGGAVLSVQSGNLSLSGSSTNATVHISESGVLTNSAGGLGDSADVTNAGTLMLGVDDVIGTYTQSGNGILGGDALLTATGGATLNGGTVTGNLSGITTVTGDLFVSGSLGGGPLSINSGALTLTGVSTNASVEIAKNASLTSTGDLGDTAEIANSGILTIHNDDLIGSFVNHGGTLDGTGRLVVAGPAVFHGGNLKGNLFAYGGVSLNDGSSVSGSLAGNIVTRGSVDVSGSLGLGLLSVESGTLTFSGKSTNPLVRIGEHGMLKNAGNLGDFALVTNAGTLTTTGNDIIGSLINNGGTLDGTGHVIVSGAATFNGGELAGKLTAYSGVTLNDGTSITGTLDGNVKTNGSVAISGTLDGGNLVVRSGTLDLSGTARSYTRIFQGAALRGTGAIDSDVLNNGILSPNNSGDRTLKISGSLATDGRLKMSLDNVAEHDRIIVGAIAAFDGRLVVTNLGEGLKTGEVARIIKADSYVGTFDQFTSKGFDNGVLFDDATGRLIGMAGGAPGSTKTYLNLNKNQTEVYLSLYEDAVEIGTQNVTKAVSIGGTRPTDKVSVTETTEFTSGVSDGDPQLIEALNLATFNDPGSVFQPVINHLSPEVHRGMADYAEQTSRAHVRTAVEGAPVSRSGKSQVFASAHSSMAGVDSSTTDAGYDLQMAGITAGIRYDLNPRNQLGGMLGADDGSIEGGLIDTDAKGITLGIFGCHVIDDASKTVLTASLSHSTYDFDAERRSFQGPVEADDINSSVAEIALGVRTVVFEKDGVRISPHGTLRYLSGRVDGFTESGGGVPLVVGKQNIESLLLELGVEAEYRILDHLTVAGNLGYVTDLSGSSANTTAHFAASGSLARPFTVSAPGVDDEAVVLGLGIHYDIIESVRVNFTYRSDFRFDSQDAHSFGIGASFGF